MIKFLKIGKLFGRFNYELKFSEDNIMIITGPNGYGKSTILKMINGFCSNGLQDLFKYSFEKFVLSCDDCEIRITKNSDNFKINDNTFPYPEEERFRRRDFYHTIRRIGQDEYIDVNSEEIIRIPSPEIFFETDETFQKDVFFSRLYFTLQIKYRRKMEYLEKLKESFKSVQQIRNSIGEIRFVQEQRLIEIRKVPDEERSYRQPSELYIKVIKENSEKLKSTLAEVMKNHSSLSSELDSTYIKRLLETNISSAANIETIMEGLNGLREKQKKLKEYALAEIKNVSDIVARDKVKLEKYLVELSIYLEDANAKYKVFESIIDKLDLYQQIVNHKLRFKSMKLSRTEGIQVISDEDVLLSLSDLSSGEQEILVLFYKLIFESDVSLLMIDEPEISLHIAWQKEIMDDLRNIVKFNKNIQVIIATHSPQIISNNWDLQIDLGEQYNG